MKPEKFYIVFTDIKGFSKLSEQLIIEFHEVINKELARKLQPALNHAVVWNTWGDATFAAFKEGKYAVNYLLEYRAFLNYQKLGGKKIQPRIAGHYGHAHVVENPFNPEQLDLLGEHINATARIEPITHPGEIFVSVDFKAAYEQQYHDNDDTNRDIRFDDLGTIKLAKDFDEFEIFRLRETDEEKHIIDKLFVEDITMYLPDIPQPTTHEKYYIKELAEKTDSQAFAEEINDHHIMPEQPTMMFQFKLAEHCKKLGLYEQCLELLSQVEQSGLRVDGELLYPFKHLPEFKKLKANALTRLGYYKDAAQIMYGLWHSGNKDTDTLCMLAAQYKRQAIFGIVKIDNIQINQDTEFNRELLTRASKLYLEAFRRNIDDYYPAINAAYLYIILNDKSSGRGLKLAIYIRQSWRRNKGESWWLDSTLAEAEMLCGDAEDAQEEFEQAIKKHNPPKFELTTTFEQIDLFAKLLGKENTVDGILNLLKQHIDN